MVLNFGRSVRLTKEESYAVRRALRSHIASSRTAATAFKQTPGMDEVCERAEHSISLLETAMQKLDAGVKPSLLARLRSWGSSKSR